MRAEIAEVTGRTTLKLNGIEKRVRKEGVLICSLVLWVKTCMKQKTVRWCAKILFVLEMSYQAHRIVRGTRVGPISTYRAWAL